MPIFVPKPDGTLKQLAVKPFSNEKELQNLVERNLEKLLDMHFIATEFPTGSGSGSGKMDTLAVDFSGVPVIIEYKLSKDSKVVMQGLRYLYWLQTQNSRFFEKLMIEKLGQERASEIEVDWKKSKLICIAESYNTHDIGAVQMIPSVELYRYTQYEDNVFSLAKVTTEHITEEKQTVNVANGQKTSESENSLFEKLKRKILEFDNNISINKTKYYFGFRVSKNFAEVHVNKNDLKIHLRPIDYDDPNDIVEKVADSYQWTMDRRVYLKSEDDMEYVLRLIKQSYNNVL